jgi:Vacuolar sorting-associated protein 13, N-terminal/N-terminal region of Chorein or VPS13
MLERLIADILVRILGQYVTGISPESVSVGVWSGHLELHRLALRPEALAILFETLGLDLPVTVIAGYIGTLTLRVPWKALRSAPVVLSIHDLTVVAAPVSDGDQEALAKRDTRLRTAHLEMDDTLRQARASVPTSAPGADESRLYRWRRMFTASVVNNIQLDVKNVIVQYQDASSVRGRPYTVSIAVNSLRGVSTDAAWKDAFIADANAPTVHKVLHLEGLVANWEPGTGDSSHAQLAPLSWSEAIRRSDRHVVSPMNGELRIALTTRLARQMAMQCGQHQPARVQMDICFPDVAFSFDDFQYHTLLATIAYLSDIDRKVRARTPRARWAWAVDRLLPRFKDRHAAKLRFTVEGIRQHRERRELYVRTRKAVVRARRNGVEADAVSSEISVLRDMEMILPIADVLFFRDMADEELSCDGTNGSMSSLASATAPSRLWGFMSVPRTSRDRYSGVAEDDPEEAPGVGEGLIEAGATLQPQLPVENDSLSVRREPRIQDQGCANFRMGFLLGRGSIQLSTGGFLCDSVGMALLVFHELRLGVTTGPGDGLLIEALLGTIEVLDIRKKVKVMYPRVGWSGQDEKPNSLGDAASSKTGACIRDVNPSSGPRKEQSLIISAGEETHSHVLSECVLSSYPTCISAALKQIRDGYEVPDPSMFRPSASGLEPPSKMWSFGSSSTGSLQSDSGSSTGSCSGRRNQLQDLTIPEGEPLDYLAALRLRKEAVPASLLGGKGEGASRLALELAIGGLEAFVDGPNGAFVSSISFWHPRESLPSVMQFLSRAAAPRLASLRMEVQRAMDQKGMPMNIDVLIRGPRFIFPGPASRQLSLVVDLGTFAVCTADDGLQPSGGPSACVDDVSALDAATDISVYHTDYLMAISDLGVFIVSAAGKKAAERLIKPFALRLLLRVLANASYLEAVLDQSRVSKLSRIRLHGHLSPVKTTISHSAFRQLLDVAQRWHDHSDVNDQLSEATLTSALALVNANEQRRGAESVQVPSDHMRVVRTQAHRNKTLIAFDARLRADAVSLELRDVRGRRVVTLSTRGMDCKFIKGDGVGIDFRVRVFTVEDGSRGATAPFQRLLHAGASSEPCVTGDADLSQAEDDLSTFCVRVSYRENTALWTQDLNVQVLSLSIFVVRETYLALADFFYKRVPVATTDSVGKADGCRTTRVDDDPYKDAGDVVGEYLDPFVALGTNTSTAVRALTERAGRSVGKAKQAFARRGQLKVVAVLDGIDLTLVTTEGAIAFAEVSNCAVQILQSPFGVVDASGDFERFSVRDLTAAYDILAQTVTYDRRKVGATVSKLADGWTLHVPEDDNSEGEVWLRVCLTGIRVVYVQRFLIVLEQYLSGLLAGLTPVLAIKGGLSNVFDHDGDKDLWMEHDLSFNRWRLDITSNDVDVVMPRHSQSAHEALRFVIGTSSVTNEEFAAPGYLVGLRVTASRISSYVLHSASREGDCFSTVGSEHDESPPSPRPLTFAPLIDLIPFCADMRVSGKLDLWRLRRCPTVVLNSDGVPVLKDGEQELEYDPRQWLPAIRVRLSSPLIAARLCEAEYSILYLVITESLVERPDIEFTDLGAHGLKTPVLPPRRPIQPIMFASNRLPPNYSILFEVRQSYVRESCLFSPLVTSSSLTSLHILSLVYVSILSLSLGGTRNECSCAWARSM